MYFGLHSIRPTKIDVLGLAANIAGILAVAVSGTIGPGEYLAFSGISLATGGMALMYLGRFQKSSR